MRSKKPAMPREQVAGILDAHLPLDHALAQVTQGGEDAHHQPHPDAALSGVMAASGPAASLPQPGGKERHQHHPTTIPPR